MGNDTRPDSAGGILGDISRQVQDQFVTNKVILSFDEFLDLALKAPTRFTRSAYQYLTDMIDHFGPRPDSEDEEPAGLAVFDQEFVNGDGAVWGQAEVEQRILRLLQGFSRSGRADKLILLHGPNGSAKTSMVSCLMRGLEAYSRTDAGAIYRFNWIFPEEKITRERIGFSKEDEPKVSSSESYAHLPEDRVSAVLSCPLRDNPLFLLPPQERAELQAKWRETDSDFRLHELAQVVRDGDLSPMNRQIFDCLLAAYGGDYARVLQHVQVERYHFSERYKVGAVTIEPQMSVDARIQQLTADRSLASLPPVLQNLNIFQPGGHLVQANHGLLEFSDLLKRPLDTYKYLLVTCEQGTANLDVAQIYLDLVMIASSNDKYLEGFKQVPDFTSFKGRMEFVRVPYLRNYLHEQRIYDEQLMLTNGDLPLMPHLTELVAQWVVMTRLRKPDPEAYPEEVRKVVERMNPLEKLRFYTNGDAPDWTSVSQAKALKSVRQMLLDEHNGQPLYEAGFGASPREGKMILQNACQEARDGCVSARQVLDEIRSLVSDKSVYEWLQIEPDGDYHNQERLIELAESFYVRKVDKELKIAMEMIEESQYIDLLERYVEQASAWIQKKKVVDAVSGEERPVQEHLLEEVESIIAPNESNTVFRQDVVSRVGAFALDHPDQEVNYEKIFKEQIGRLEQHYFTRQQERISKLHEQLLRYMSDRRRELNDEDGKFVAGVLDRMQRRYGYAPECTRAVMTMLMNTRYAQ